MPHNIQVHTSPRDLPLAWLPGGIVRSLRELLAIEPVVAGEKAPTDSHRQDPPCASLQRCHRHHHLIDDNPSSG